MQSLLDMPDSREAHQEKIEKIRARWARATIGPWEIVPDSRPDIVPVVHRELSTAERLTTHDLALLRLAQALQSWALREIGPYLTPLGLERIEKVVDGFKVGIMEFEKYPSETDQTFFEGAWWYIGCLLATVDARAQDA